MSSVGQNLRDVLKLLFWPQLLARGQLRLLARYYGLVWLVAGLLTGLSIWMLVQPNGVSKVANIAPGIVIAIGLAMIALSYVLTRAVGTLCVVLLAFVLPGTIVITPSVQSATVTQVEEESDSGGLTTGDLGLFLKGAGTCGVLGVVAAMTWWATVTWRQLHWPPRRVVAVSMLIAGLLALELLRVAARPFPGFRAFWDPRLGEFLAEPGWPFALAAWIWLAVGHFLAVYDMILIPHLLRRAGQTWVKYDLRLHEAYMVDELLNAISSGDRPRRSRGRS